MPGRAEFHESWGWCQHAKFGEQLRYEEPPRAQDDHTLSKTNREVDVKMDVWLRKSIREYPIEFTTILQRHHTGVSALP